MSVEELPVLTWTGRDGVERVCPVRSEYDGRVRTCKRRECERCGPAWARDWFRSMSANLAAYGGRVVLVTVTAPGEERLPWDEHYCRAVRGRGPRHKKHRGPDGCRVQQRAAREWSDTLSWRWARLRAAAQQATKRELRALGLPVVPATLLERAYEPQRRGVPHLHLVVGYRTDAEQHAAHLFVKHLKRLVGEYDFGFADAKGRKRGVPQGPRVTRHGVELAVKTGEDAARYLASYLTGRNSKKKTSIRDNIADPVMPRSLIWLTPKLTSKPEAITVDGRPTLVTMRLLRRARHLFAAAKGLCEPPKWRDMLDAAQTAVVYRRAFNRRTGGDTDDDGAHVSDAKILGLAEEIERQYRRHGRWMLQLDEVTSFAYTIAGLTPTERMAAAA